MPFKTRDDAIASLKALTFRDDYADYERNPDGSMKTVDDEAIWIVRDVPLTEVFPLDDAAIVVGNDDGVEWFDYYGECKGETPWIHPVLERWAKEHRYLIEWRDPGSLILFPEVHR